MTKSYDFTIALLALISGLTLSAVAIYYSVIGLTSIFAAAVIPVMVMGISIEISKLVMTVWLKRHWSDASKLLIFPLLSAVIILMFITSFGVYGFLSKAHSDQAVPSGAVVEKLSLVDERINAFKAIVNDSKSALKHLDIVVDQTIERSSSEQSILKSIQIRRSQSKERNQIQNDIDNAQSAIRKLQEERIPIANQLRHVEAEIGPIKYIAALLFDKVDSSILEKSVRWMIILIVSVFDPVAILLLLASQHSFKQLASNNGINNTSEVIEISPTIANVNDDSHTSNSSEFPKNPISGQIFTRTDYDPPKEFIFNGNQWVSNLN